jgi:hypothetical protein
MADAANAANPTPSIPRIQATFIHPTIHGRKETPSASGTTRRHSLQLHFLPPSLWSANTSTASLVESEEVVRGEHTLDEATVANRISALRQLNGATRSRHRYAKSTGARQSTFNQPVIVRTYSGAARPRAQQRDLVTVKKENGHSTMKASQVELKLPPVEAFSFKGIMDEIRHGVTEDLERIAEICARSKYSLSNQYEVHMPPHGRGEAILVGSVTNGGGPTLQAIGSDDEHSRHIRRGAARRTKSAAYGTLETIMSSSRSSEEDKSKKKSAAVLAEEVRGRAAKKELDLKNARTENAVEAGPSDERPTKHVRSKSATFASMIIDNAQGSKNDAVSNLVSPTSLISEPARPQTSNAELDNIATFGEPSQPSSTMEVSTTYKPSLGRQASRLSPLRPQGEAMTSIMESISSWLPWGRSSASNTPAGITRGSHAEGSLRNLLRSTNSDRKGKGVDRSA